METLDYTSYDAMLKVAGEFHGHVCAGICIGTRMAIAGMKKVGISDPRGADRKKLIVFVEIDRCATDAIMAITGCSPGRRSMKIFDYGKMAATFHNLETGKSVRLVARRKQNGQPTEPEEWGRLNEEEIFSVQDVRVFLAPEDLPGKPLRRRDCARCGGSIMDGREVEANGECLCRPCAAGKDYYQPA